MIESIAREILTTVILLYSDHVTHIWDWKTLYTRAWIFYIFVFGNDIDLDPGEEFYGAPPSANDMNGAMMYRLSAINCWIMDYCDLSAMHCYPRNIDWSASAVEETTSRYTIKCLEVRFFHNTQYLLQYTLTETFFHSIPKVIQAKGKCLLSVLKWRTAEL